MTVAKYYSASAFWSRLAIVVTGAGMAQIIPFLVMPIITRMLPPEILGPYFIWLGIVAILSILLSLRLDVAIFNAQTTKELRIAIQTTFIMAVIISLMLWGVISILKIGSPNTYEYLKLNCWSVEAIILAAVWAINMSLQNAYIYGGFFKKQAVSQVAIAILVAISQIGAVTIGWQVKGIINLQIIASIMAMLIIAYDIKKLYKIRYSEFNIKYAHDSLKKNWRLPLISMPADLIGSIGGQLPTILLGNRYGADLAGQFALMNKAIAAPSKLIAGSILTVFKEEASRKYREDKECKNIFLLTLRRLILLGIVPFGMIYLYSDNLFKIIFGDEWAEAGTIASYLAPMFYMQFIASPLSYMLYLSGRNLDDLKWQCLIMLSTLTIFLMSDNAMQAIIYMSICYTVLYALNIYISFKAASGKLKK